MKYDIEKYAPCKDALEWYNNQPDSRTAWETCPRGDWMLWIARRLGVDQRKLFLAKGYCAKTVLHLMKDERSKKAVDVAIAYGEGKATNEELNSAYAEASSVVSTDAVFKNIKKNYSTLDST